ncbi:hypothetical protein O0I10_001388 [Lichtheimia ornata]|uniref:non-specific serine/threonine protein kinase n=1 Tax=Lichtheimia ornata TaxID=688661 RepID=A0AAD8DI96_9FUNG|nr:uncharacterized protein O0I10_001388 [Lichtheimia ornata]KAJ8663211.1 hypothetical protein O0I10_001388 [Lichtheimia ornata]
MGNKISNVTAIAGIDSYVSELGDIYYERSIGNARFMKTIRGRHKDTLVVVKIFVKPDPQLSLRSYVKKLQDEHDALINVSNAFPFQRILETDKAAYLVRQYFCSSLYDRISTRPFLTLIEKKWIAYQILKAVASTHAKKIYHGDIKTENVLVTSWNWVYLVDFASYKPTYLPEDNPADFSFFFDMSSRRCCYIAPERFYNAGTAVDQRMKNLDWDEQVSELTPEMDIFSVGCVIAELFLEGTSIFSLSQLFKYRSGEYNPDNSLDKIDDENIKSMVKHMIQLDPKDRFTAEQYLSEWRGKAFPQYFYTFLHQYISSVTEPIDYEATQQSTAAVADAMSSALMGVNSISKKLIDADEKIERIYHDFDKIAYFVSFQGDSIPTTQPDSTTARPGGPRERRRTLTDLPNTTASSIILPPILNIPNYEPENTTVNHVDHQQNSGEHGTLIFLSFVCSLLRNASFPSSKLKALDILLALAEHLPDDVKLDRLVPYLMTLLSDDAALVRANAIKTLTQVLCMVESISPINARIFPEYILPNVCDFAKDEDVLVRTTYASCIALLAETALRFLEMTQLLKSDSSFPVVDMDTDELDFESAYDSSLQDLKSVIQEQVTALLIDSESSVKRALLTNITCLCVFFGRQIANDLLLSHMITYLNDKDWMLRSAFFESIKGVGTCVGARSLEEYILPLMVQALTDAEEFVVEKVLNTYASLAELDLFSKMKLWELIGIIAPLICHPSVWIRHGAVGFIVSASKHLPETDIWCIIYPLLTPFLKADISSINEEELMENAKTPLSRQIYEQAIGWATKATSKSLFWKHQREKRARSNAPRQRKSGPAMLLRQGSLLTSAIGEEIEVSQEDEYYLERLRNIGMSAEDEEIIALLRDYLYKVSHAKLNRPKGFEDRSIVNGDVFLKSIGVTPLTVFLPDLSQDTPFSQDLSSNYAGGIERPSTMQTRAKQNSCKISRVASEPHVQAILPDLDKSTNPETASVMSNSGLISSPTDISFDVHSAPQPRTKGSLSPSELDERARFSTSTPKSIVGYEHLQNLLMKTALEAFPPHMPEFTGDPAIMKRIKRLPQGTSPFRTVNSWKPDGTLVAHFTEHTAGINQLAISWDNLLFASCSDDGSVKIWDCFRLERNVTNRSRATYNQQGGRIKCITFIHQTYSIASASDNGSIHVFRVDIRSTGSALKFGKCIPVRRHQLMNEYAVCIQHFTSNASNTMAGSKSILLFATNKGNIYAMDLMTMEVLWQLKNPLSHGVITSMVTDRLHTWMMVGTTRGILTLYDLRFQIPLRSWLHHSKSRINTMLLSHDPKAEGKHVIIAAGKNEISVWDIVQLRCVEVFLVRPGDEKTVTNNGIATDVFQALEAPNEEDILGTSCTSSEAHFSENSIRAVVSPPDCRFIITGGSDRKLRFWDTARIENSSVVLGLDMDEPKPRFRMSVQNHIKFYLEFAQAQRTSTSSTSMHRTAFSGSGSHHSSPSEINFAQQQSLLRNHTDAVMDVILTEVPYPMIISGDRDGVIKVVS